MTVFGYQIEYGRLSPKEQRDWEEYAYAPTYFGIGSWTINIPIHKSVPHPTKTNRKARQLVGKENGLYIHVWLFGYRFDVNFRKKVLV